MRQVDSTADGPLVGSGGEPVYSERALWILGVQSSAWNTSGRIYSNRGVVSFVLLQVARTDYSAWVLLDGHGLCGHLCSSLGFWIIAHEGCWRIVWLEVVILGRGEEIPRLTKVKGVGMLTRFKQGLVTLGFGLTSFVLMPAGPTQTASYWRGEKGWFTPRYVRDFRILTSP